MGKGSYFIIGAALGAALSAAVNYLFGPAPNTTYDDGYRSRLDWALDAGDRAANEREAELRLQFESARLPRPQRPAPPSAPTLPAASELPDIPPETDPSRTGLTCTNRLNL